MDCLIRNARTEDYEQVIRIMDQVQRMHIEWRPDIYRENDNIIPPETFKKIVDEKSFFVAESDHTVVGIMKIMYRHIESPSQVTRNVVFIDLMAVDRDYRGMGIGHLFFEKVKAIKEGMQFDGIELQVNAKNKAAYEMYLKYGFTEKSINMELL